MSLTLRHFLNARQSRQPYSVQESDYFAQDTGIVTLQFPHESIAVPDNGRYQLDCEIDDCIVCDKCAKICPVDCIDIEPIKSSEIISYASDGSPIRLYAAKFDIDMAKCCFCGLCTTVCPTECLTMTNQYDFSVVDITEMNFQFANMTAQEADEKRKLYEQFVAEKEALKSVPKPATTTAPSIEETDKPKPSFKPNFKPVIKPVEVEAEKEVKESIAEETLKVRPVFKPVMKPVKKAEEEEEKQEEATEEKVEETPKPAARPTFKPVMKAVKKVEEEEVKQEIAEEKVEEAPKPAARPTFKPVMKVVKKAEEAEVKPEVSEETVEEAPKPKPVFKPTMKIQPKKPE